MSRWSDPDTIQRRLIIAMWHPTYRDRDPLDVLADLARQDTDA